jgi:hypothetical protein
MQRRTHPLPRYVFTALLLVLEVPVLIPLVIGAVVTRVLLALVDGARHVRRLVSRTGHAIGGVGLPA